MGRLLTVTGAFVTITYSMSIFWLMGDRVNQLMTMPLNELGDFLAGVFGPLAIFWLILGFLQQGKELQQSTQALELQAKELNNSVQQQKQLVEVSRQQMETEMESLKYERQRQVDIAKPNFIFQGIGATYNSSGLSEFNTRVKNTGGGVTLISLTADTDIKLSPTVIHSWETNLDKNIKWEYKKGESNDIANFSIRYTDYLGNHSEEKFEITMNNEAQCPTAEIHRKANN